MNASWFKSNGGNCQHRGVESGKDCISPAKHQEFSTPKELINFVYKLEKTSNNKPVGIKLCVGHPWEFISIVKTMVTMKICRLYNH